MATRKSLDVRKTEKYMDDAFSAAFSNLQKAAERKSSHVLPKKSETLSSIHGESEKPKTSSTCERNDFAKENSKISWRVMCPGDSDNIKTQVDESDWEKETGEEKEKFQWRRITTPNSEDGWEKYLNVYGSPHDSKRKSYHQSRGGLSTSKEFAAHQEPSSNCLPPTVKRRENMSFGDVFKLRSDSRSFELTETKAKPPLNRRSGMRKKNDADEEKAIKFRGNLQRKHLSHRQNNTTRPTSPANGLSSENGRYNAKEDDSDFKSQFFEVKYQETSTDQSSMKSSLDKKMDLRPKRTRHDSESSSDSRVPLQKKVLARDVHRKASSSNMSENLLETMLSVKVIKDIKWHEYIISLSDFDRIRRKYPKFSEVLPNIDTEEKEIHYCFDAVKAVLGFLFHPPYNYNMMPGVTVAVEVLAAAKSWSILHFHTDFQSEFLKKITRNNFSTIYSFATHFGLQEICDACQTFASDEKSLNKSLNERLVKPRKCSVLISTYVDPSEYCIPLENAEKDFDDFFDKDIRNTIIFEAVSSDCGIEGFGILLDTESCNQESSTLDIFYTAKIMNGNFEAEEIKQSKPVRSNIVIHFKRTIDVKKGEKLEISVETTIKPSMCFASRESVIDENTSEVEFRVYLESTYKVGNSDGKRFFIGKLLYNALDAIN